MKNRCFKPPYFIGFFVLSQPSSEDETAVYHKKLTGNIPEAIEVNLSGTIQKLCYDEEKKVVYEILNSSDTFFLTGTVPWMR